MSSCLSEMKTVFQDLEWGIQNNLESLLWSLITKRIENKSVNPMIYGLKVISQNMCTFIC